MGREARGGGGGGWGGVQGGGTGWGYRRVVLSLLPLTVITPLLPVDWTNSGGSAAQPNR